MTDRRRFLAEILASGAALAVSPLGSRASPQVRDGVRERVPGEIVTVAWPRSLDGRDAEVVMVRGGREVERNPVPRPRGLLFQRIDVVLMPSDGRLRPGRHDFFVECEGRRVALGGFSVQGFRFGF
jgi:hypothetical protein